MPSEARHAPNHRAELAAALDEAARDRGRFS